MTWITVAWPMVAAACITLGAINLAIGLAHPPRAARLIFSVNAFAVAVFSAIELLLMRAHTVAEFAYIEYWGDLSWALIVVSLVAFVWVYFGTGTGWLAAGMVVLLAASLIIDYVVPSGLVWQRITDLRSVETYGGASFAVAEGVPSPWVMVSESAELLLLIFVVDASIRLWRRGERRRAAVVGGGITFFVLAMTIHSALVESDTIRSPYLISWFYLGILVTMGYELSADVFAAAQLGRRVQEGEQRMDLASAAADLGLWSWDVDRDAIWANSRARELLGFSESVHLDLARLLGALHPDDRDSVRRGIQSALESDREFDVEFRVPNPEGKTSWIAARGRVERDVGGTPVLLRGVALDRTARRRADTELQELRGQLAHVSRVSMLGQLASALAHELNQPLGAILRNAEAAEMFLQFEPPSLNEVRAILADIRKDDQRAGDVIERLRALLKRRSIEPRTLRLDDLLRSVGVLARADAAARHIRLDIETVSDLPEVTGDKVHLQQVLLNLVLNAMDAVDAAPAAERSVSLRAQRDGAATVELAVIDTGVGIPPEALGALFDPFFTTKPDGMGIGLPISRTIVEAHGGRIWAENNARKGATFRFTLPVAERAMSAAV